MGTREEQERIFGRLRAVGVRLHQKLNAPDADVLTVPDEVKETDEGFEVSMIDGRGELVEVVYLDKAENILRREGKR